MSIRALGIALVTVSCVACERTYSTRQSDALADRSQANAEANVPANRGTSAGEADMAVVTSLADIPYNASIQSELDRVNPRRDGWETETFSEQASSQLKQLARRMQKAASPDAPRPESLVDPEFSSTRLRPTDLHDVFRDGWFSVQRSKQEESRDEVEHHGIQGLQRALDQLRSDLDLGASVELDVHFKVVRVNRTEQTVETLVYVELAAKREQVVIQQTAQWTCGWSLGEAAPRLRRVEVVQFEEVRSPRPLFSDDTATLLGGNPSYAEHLVFGYDHWRQSLDWRFGMEVAGPYGLTVGDVNGDELDDVFFCETGGLPNRLFVQLGDGTAVDRSAESGLDFLEPTHSGLLIDLDNDGDQDMVLASSRYILLMENDGTGRFTRRGIHATMSVARSMAAADFDSDGDLDIYVCGYFPREAASDGIGLGRPMPYHDANNGVRNYLLANQGAWQFADVTTAVGLDANNRRFSYAASWEDYDNDGDPDLYVANDFGRNNLYRNDGGHFVDVAADAGVEDMSAGMSVSWGDYDRDGWMDIYVGNMFSSAGNRITYQRRFKPGDRDETRSQFQRHARGNSLFRNRGDGSFEDVSVAAGVTMGRWSWSSNFVDLNNDGWDDLLVANGMVTSQDDPDDL
jgi:hypothetical protein